MAGVNLLRNQLFDKYQKQGMSEEDALMRADRESRLQLAAKKPAQQTSRIRMIKRPTGRRSHFAEVLAALRTKKGRREIIEGGKAYLYETPAERKKRVALERAG